MQNLLPILMPLRNLLRVVRAALGVLAGLVCFGFTGRTPAFAYQSLVRLFTLTSGYSNDALSRWIGWWRRPYCMEKADGILGINDRASMQRTVDDLRLNGYVVFDKVIPDQLCDKLLQFALNHPCKARARDGGSDDGAPPGIYPRHEPQAIIYDFHPGDLINQPDVQSLMGDKSFIWLAQEYLGAQPVLDTVNLWWTTAFAKQPDGNAAQLYHFDMDHVRWLKFFVYLTDMTPASGPHCFIAGSHRSGGIPRHFLQRGYVRLSDPEVKAVYPPHASMEFTGGRGTIIAEDTRGLHKGKPVLHGDRLMLELEFSNSLFGAVLPERGKITSFHDSAFARFALSHPRIFERWLSSMPS